MTPPSVFHAVALVSVAVMVGCLVLMVIAPNRLFRLFPVAGIALATMVLAWTAGLLLQPAAFVAPERPKAPDSVTEARLLGAYLLGGLLLLGGVVAVRWRRWRHRQNPVDG
ncbi:hypothetical protein [Nocardioides sp. R-C-SC26]|uniref:hypothetical protein n=1 Tax=Nocardioides sp. R-C-SC26 TaxID=2870414 RepID=UPI001E46A4BC|nr:hypothetical protein [Nocardioides sp. R-C-SC26]